MLPIASDQIDFRLADVLADRHIKPAEFARRTQIKESTVYEILKRRTSLPRPKHLAAILRTLNLTLGDIVRFQHEGQTETELLENAA